MSEKFFNPNGSDPAEIKSQIDAEADELLKEGDLSSFGVPKDETAGVDQKAHIDAMNASQEDEKKAPVIDQKTMIDAMNDSQTDNEKATGVDQKTMIDAMNASQKDQDAEKPDQYKGIPETIVEAEYVDDKQKKEGEKKEFYPLEAVKKEDNAEAIKARKEEIEKCRQEVSDMRKEYLKVDYEKNTALSRVRKFFGNIGKDKQEKGLEQDQEVAEFRAYYDNKLLDLQQKIVEDAKERGASDKELADIYIEFRTEQKITLAEEHDNVKIEQQEGSIKGVIGEKLVQVSKWYQKLPFKTKIAVSVAFMGVGGGLALAGIGAGTAAASVFAGAVTARRLFSGMTAGVGTSLGLEAWGQKKDKKSVEKEKEEFLKKMEGLDEKAKYELLTGNIKDIAIKDEENSINRIKNQDIKQLAAGAAVGTFIGSGMMADFVKWGVHGISEHVGWGPTGVTYVPHGTGPDSVPISSNIFDSSNVRAGGLPGEDISKDGFPNMGIKDIAEGKSPLAPPDFSDLTEHDPVMPSGETLTIQQGSSIEKTLIDNMKANHPEIKNPGAAAHRMFLDYMEDNKENIIKKVGDGEYSKMLKDGMVNVKAGTGLKMVMENGQLKLDDIDGKISHLEHYHPAGGGYHGPSEIIPEQPLYSEPLLQESSGPSQQPEIPKMGNVLEQTRLERDSVMAKILDTQGKLKELNIKHDALFANSVNDGEFERMDKLMAATEIEKEIERLNGNLRELNSDLSGLNNDMNIAENAANPRMEQIQSSRAGIPGDHYTKVTQVYDKWEDANVKMEDKWENANAKMEDANVKIDDKWEDANARMGNKWEDANAKMGARVIETDNIAGTKADATNVLEHKVGTIHTLDYSDLHMPKGCSVAFEYDSQGNPILKEMQFKGIIKPGESQEFFEKDWRANIREKYNDFPNKAMVAEKGLSHQGLKLAGDMKIYKALLDNGYTKEAAAVLKSINNVMDITEKKLGMDGIYKHL